ncbi:hypothetical protein SAMN04487941_0821 [Pontibacter akesuensis]|uniref:Uncharacterized protein n=2 Tax=Pontibacter akesuensis TaxID=388950 RepID=A0A1I7G8X6_9BACT|nr:hypothetical protein SAMN04487941_0821 [Pontibacter akesuensis]
MRLRVDDIKGPPILDSDFMFREHKIGSYYSKYGFSKRVKQLKRIIETDLNNIENFVQRWYKMHKRPIVTTWEGHQIEEV